MKEVFADETSLKLLSKYILKNKTFILHFMINSEYFLINKAAFGGLVFHLHLKICYFDELVGDNRGRNHRCDIAWTARICTKVEKY